MIDDVPEGGEDDLFVIETHGEPRDFEAEGVTVRDHLELGQLLDGIDMARGAKVSGSRFYFLKGQVAQLEFALSQFALNKALRAGLHSHDRAQPGEGRSHGRHRVPGQAAVDVYHLEADDLYLVGTAEVPLAAYHSDEIIDAGKLPLHYAGFSSAFRREAGSYGKDTRGIFRVHWFDKWELFVYCEPEDAEAEHELILQREKEFLNALGVPFQVLDVASGDLGLSAARKYDCYAWVPSQQRYREVSSTSNCTDFQARRLNIRQRDADGVRPLATLNGTLCAMTRMIIVLLENNQQADGSVVVPEVLRPYMGGKATLDPAR